MLPVTDAHSKSVLLTVLDACFRDNQNASHILPDGSSERIQPKEGEKPLRMQAWLTEFFTQKTEAEQEEIALQLVPHLPKEE
jgi:polyphosphate kinase